MSSAQSGSPSPTAAAAAAASNHWAPHGPLLTACLVGLNVFMIVLIFFYFWRFFSGKRGPSSQAGADEAPASADTSPATSPRASWRQRGLHLDQPDIASSLPVSVYSAGAGAGGKDCAVCITEFRDDDLARSLPRCGHRFHAACVGAWLQLHATCPLCRASVVAPAAAGDEPKSDDDTKDDDVDGAADCPV